MLSLPGRISALVTAVILLASAAHAAPPGAIISNQATFEYRNAADQVASVPSNVVELTAAVQRSPADVQWTRLTGGGAAAFTETLGPSACLSGGVYTDYPDPTVLGGNVIDPTVPQDIVPTSAYNIGEAAFLRLDDADQNVDYQVIDTAVVTVSSASTGDSEVVRLTETGPDTGIFAGFVPTSGGAATVGDCVLQGAPRSGIDVDYTDPADTVDSARASAQFDPIQRVFESRTGSSVSGATIEIVDAATGLPAVVYGNDGVSQFPSAIVSGSSVTDSSGTTYVFGPGEYRFPVVPDGDYRLVVTPPAAYSAPSVVDAGVLQSLPGAPFALGPGSFGVAFTKAGELSTRFDIPLDPRAESLYLDKRTLTTTAAPGDFVRYELIVENTSASGIASATRIVDTLPAALRYVAGSTRRDAAGAADPAVSDGGRTLEFDIGVLDPGQRVEMSYVTEVIGGGSGSEIVNTATAFAGGGLVSNEAASLVRLTEDLLRSTGTIIGRVLEGECSEETFSEEQGVANVRVYLEDGRYAITDEGGRFHFEGLTPGTHVAQLDTFTVPDYFDVIACADASEYAGASDSQFVRLSRGSLRRADFYLRRKPAPEGRIDMELMSRGTDSAEQVAYDVTINGIGNVRIADIDVRILMPDGVHYQPGSMRIDGEYLGDPRVSGPVLSLALPDRIGSWTSKASFIASIDSHVSGELSTRAYAEFDSPIESGQRTPVAETLMLREPGTLENAGYVLNLTFDVLSAELSVEDRQKLDALISDWRGVRDIALSTVGHTDSQRIAARNRHLFADNYALSRARAASVAGYIGAALGLSDHNVQTAGRGADEPVATNATVDGRARNRRVELVMSGVRPSRPSFLEVTKASSGAQAVDTRGAVPGTENRVQSAADAAPDTALGEEPPIESLSPGIGLLLPTSDFAPAIPATKISVKHAPSDSVSVWVNDRPVNAANFDTVAYNEARTVAVSRWKGVELVDGANDIRVVVASADGTTAETMRRRINYSGQPVRAEVVADQSTLVADGKTRPVVAVRLFDRAGKPSRRGMVGGYRVQAPYRSWWEVEQERGNELVQIGAREPTYRIGADGVALIELAPTTQTGEVTLTLNFDDNRTQELRAWMRPAPRDWILVGFAEGTAGYNTLSDNVAAAIDAGYEDEYYEDGRVAFFAKGQIKGEYLLTLAYDSSRDRRATRDRFETVVDPNAYYPLYADASEQRFEAASQRKLYVKLERGQFFALFGDFDTGLSITELARYQRRFNGLQSEYRGEHLGFTAFAAESSQAFNRDELRGDGTSGLYRLSAAPIIANSETVRIEIRDRFDSGQVIETTTLSRFLDYNLDTLNGTLYFKKPVPSRDLAFNPVYIVVEYETTTTSPEDVVAGGRVSLGTSSDGLEVGVTHIDDSTSGAEADLTGVDLRWQINEQTLLKAETARSNRTAGGAEVSGAAHSVTLEHNGETADVRAFIREVEDDFGLGYQSAADAGARRLGIDARLRFGDHWRVEGEAGWQQMLATEDIRNLARAQLRYSRETFSTSLGVVHAEDRFDDGDTRTSDLAEIALTKRILDNRVALRATASTPLNEDPESVDFTSGYVIGADYRLGEGIDLIAEYEESEGRDVDASMTRVGVRATPWARAQVDTSLTNEVTEFGPRLFANVGLVQGFELGERWLFDVGVDQSNTLEEAGARRFDPDRELPSGSVNEDFLAAHVGAMYTAELWSANARVEYRNADTEERGAVTFGWYREPSSGHGLSAGLTLFRTDAVSGSEATTANLKFGWAYRPSGRKWSFLDRLDVVYDDSGGATATATSWRLINNFNANRRISASTQLSLQYAFKYVQTSFDGDSYAGFTDLVGFDVRRGFGGRYDAGINASVYHAWQSDVIDYGFGVDVGYRLANNVWLSLGYNLAGFDDEDFRAARYTASGPFLRFSIKADQRILKNIAGQR